jgi:hypothetical protein
MNQRPPPTRITTSSPSRTTLFSSQAADFAENFRSLPISRRTVLASVTSRISGRSALYNPPGWSGLIIQLPTRMRMTAYAVAPQRAVPSMTSEPSFIEAQMARPGSLAVVGAVGWPNGRRTAGSVTTSPHNATATLRVTGTLPAGPR